MRYLCIFLTCLQVHDKVLQFLIFKIRKKNIFFFKIFHKWKFWYFFQFFWTLTTKIFFGRPENLWTVIKLYCACSEVSFYIFNMPTSTRQSFTIFNFQDPKKKYFFFQNFPQMKFSDIFFSFCELWRPKYFLEDLKIYEQYWSFIVHALRYLCIFLTCLQVNDKVLQFLIFKIRKKNFFFQNFPQMKILIFFSVFLNFDDQNIFWKTWKSMNSHKTLLCMFWGIFLYF